MLLICHSWPDGTVKSSARRCRPSLFPLAPRTLLATVVTPVLCCSSDHCHPAGAAGWPFSAVVPVRTGALSYNTWAGATEAMPAIAISPAINLETTVCDLTLINALDPQHERFRLSRHDR